MGEGTAVKTMEKEEDVILHEEEGGTKGIHPESPDGKDKNRLIRANENTMESRGGDKIGHSITLTPNGERGGLPPSRPE